MIDPLVLRCRRLRSICGLRFHRWRESRRHHLVRSTDGSSGFAAFGCPWTIPHLTREYLGEETDQPRGPQTRLLLRDPVGSARRLARELGLVVYHPNALPDALRAEVLPLRALVNLEIELPAAFPDYTAAITSGIRGDLQKIRRENYRATSTRDLSALGAFERDYYLPSTDKRHGAAGIRAPLAPLVAGIPPGRAELNQVFQDQDWVAGNLCEDSDDGYRLWGLGWKNGEPGLLRKGAATAVYWFSIQRAHALGRRRVLPGGASPYLDDKLLEYKGKWGARLAPGTDSYQVRHLLLDPAHPATRRYLDTHALLILRDATSYFVVGGRSPDEVPAFRHQAGRISAWFRLRTSPAAAPRPGLGLLPKTLQAWFDPLPVA